jgi:hypothetical protein
MAITGSQAQEQTRPTPPQHQNWPYSKPTPGRNNEGRIRPRGSAHRKTRNASKAELIFPDFEPQIEQPLAINPQTELQSEQSLFPNSQNPLQKPPIHDRFPSYSWTHPFHLFCPYIFTSFKAQRLFTPQGTSSRARNPKDPIESDVTQKVSQSRIPPKRTKRPKHQEEGPRKRICLESSEPLSFTISYSKRAQADIRRLQLPLSPFYTAHDNDTTTLSR